MFQLWSKLNFKWCSAYSFIEAVNEQKNSSLQCLFCFKFLHPDFFLINQKLQAAILQRYCSYKSGAWRDYIKPWSQWLNSFKLILRRADKTIWNFLLFWHVRDKYRNSHKSFISPVIFKNYEYLGSRNVVAVNKGCEPKKWDIEPCRQENKITAELIFQRPSSSHSTFHSTEIKKKKLTASVGNEKISKSSNVQKVSKKFSDFFLF